MRSRQVADEPEVDGEEPSVDAARVVEIQRELGVLTEAELAALADNDVRTVKNWRTQRSGPPYVKLGRRAFYRIESLKAWLPK